MKRDTATAGTCAAWRTRIVAAAWLLSLTVLGSCRFLADEFTWLDRAGPVADGQPDAPTIGTVDRP